MNINALNVAINKLNTQLLELQQDMGLVKIFYDQTTRNNNALSSALASSTTVSQFYTAMKASQNIAPALEYDIVSILTGNFKLVHATNNLAIKSGSGLGNVQLRDKTGFTEVSFGIYSGAEVVNSQYGFFRLNVQNRGTSSLNVQQATLNITPFVQNEAFSFILEQVPNTSSEYYLVTTMGYVAWNPTNDVLFVASKGDASVCRWKIVGTLPNLSSYVISFPTLLSRLITRYNANTSTTGAFGIWNAFDSSRIDSTGLSSVIGTYKVTFASMIKNGPTYYTFNGTNSTAVINTNNVALSQFSHTGNYTMCMWVWLDDQVNKNAAAYLIDKTNNTIRNENTKSPLRVYISNSRLIAGASDGSRFDSLDAADFRPHFKKWTFITAVFEASPRKLSVYVNGVLANSKTMTVTSIDNTDNILIMSRPVLNMFTKGHVAKLSLYQVALSQATITNLFVNTRSIVYSLV